MLMTKKLMNFRPAVILTAGLILGILIGYLKTFISSGLAVAIFIMIATVILAFAIFFIVKKRKLKFVFCILIIAATLLGMILMGAKLKFPTKTINGEKFEGSVKEIYFEYLTDSGYDYSVLIKGDIESDTSAVIYAKLSTKTRIYQGTKISFIASFKPINEGDYSFSSGAKFAATDISNVQVLGLNGLIPEMKFKLLKSLEQSLPKTFYLTYALLTGETVYIPNSKIINYQNVGVAHLFAVSGLHIGLLYGVLAVVFSLLKVKAKISFPIIELLLFCYAGFCGFSASTLRAFIIISVRQSASLLGVKSDKSTNLFLSAFIVLAINPTDLFTLGFLLPFSVYAGLIFLANPLEKRLSKFLPKFFAKILAPCLISEIVSMPILIDMVGYCSAFGFLFNMVIIPFITLLYPLILFSTILLAVTGFEIFAIIPNLSFAVIDRGLSLASTEIFMLRNFRFLISAIFYYLTLYTFSGKLNLSGKSLNILRIIILLAFILTFCAVNLPYCIDFFNLKC